MLTKTQKRTLANLVRQNQGILFSKFGPNVTRKKKESIWEAIRQKLIRLEVKFHSWVHKDFLVFTFWNIHKWRHERNGRGFVILWHYANRIKQNSHIRWKRGVNFGANLHEVIKWWPLRIWQKKFFRSLTRPEKTRLVSLTESIWPKIG